jgi:hypothetical protein
MTTTLLFSPEFITLKIWSFYILIVCTTMQTILPALLDTLFLLRSLSRWTNPKWITWNTRISFFCDTKKDSLQLFFPEDKETTFVGKVGNKLLSDAVSYPTKMHSSATSLNKKYAFYFLQLIQRNSEIKPYKQSTVILPGCTTRYKTLN